MTIAEGELTKIGAMAECFAPDTALAVTTDAVALLGGSAEDLPAERFVRNGTSSADRSTDQG